MLFCNNHKKTTALNNSNHKSANKINGVVLTRFKSEIQEKSEFIAFYLVSIHALLPFTFKKNFILILYVEERRRMLTHFT